MIHLPISLSRLLLFCLILPAHLLQAQVKPTTTTSKRAEKYFMDAQDYYYGRDNRQALDALEKALKDDPQFVEAWMLQGELLVEADRTEEAITSYKRAATIQPDFFPPLYFRTASLELRVGKYSDAREDITRFLKYPKIPPDLVAKAKAALKTAEYGVWAVAHPVPYNPVNLGDSVNTKDDEYVNAITADEQKLYFTRLIPVRADQPELREEDFYVSAKCDTVWCKARDMGSPINTRGNEGAISISPDGQFLFFAACNREDGFGSCDIYGARKQGENWSVPQNLGQVVNSPSWDSQPSFSSDGKTLYFASKRPGGKGSSDIWSTELQVDGSWTVPINLGDSINTPFEEMAPFIHPDDQTLYFSSRGHQGLGGQDLFCSRRDVNRNWRKPFNLGYPINSSSDEITLIVKPSGDLAYISSDKLGGKGRQDIYAFPLYKEAQPLKSTYFKGVVYDKATKQRLLAVFELVDLSTGRLITRANSDPVTGEFLLSLPTGKDYALSVSRQGYLFYSDNFALQGDISLTKPFIKDVPLQKIQTGEKVVLRNIFFDTDKYNLKQESVIEIDKLVAFLKTNPSLHIEINGHTDNKGGPEYNLSLSRNRAKAVYDFLVSKGIAPERLTYVGYGLTQPVDSNATEEGRAKNRRTEFTVTGN